MRLYVREFLAVYTATCDYLERILLNFTFKTRVRTMCKLLIDLKYLREGSRILTLLRSASENRRGCKVETLLLSLEYDVLY